MLNSNKAVMYIQRLHRFCNIHPTLMMAHNRTESIREPINHGRFINQFQLDTIKSISQIKKENTKICWLKCLYCLMNVYISFQAFFTNISNCRRLLKIQYVIAIYLMRWLNNFYDFRFKWTATAGIRIHPTKAWLSLLVNFKNTIWTWGHFRRTICNKILS